ncbi:restriction endonuclease subunit S [Pseudoalteromonas sp. ACER1]|uniref:restriction endonuclease subunit S n=1 Tax=unclassified Pseudoalteromonas TaxID=194690 RepID=UPI001F219722|nr:MULTISPECIES: restriction endonuclease subunit S [unclassified Pseudoalteromonas]MCF2848350.1 restriction endonuclease subunit S [Pseudoalteromonas sp. PAST1]MCO7213273.1 restriction endonuclease subunit S [Pseudoalteromonas sp. ACER1]
MVPNGWKKGVIEDIAKVSSGGTPSRQNDSYWLGGQIPWVTTTEVQFGVIKGTEQKITEAGLKNSSAKLFPKDTILMAMYGQGKTRGQVAKLGIEASTNQACAALLLNDGFEVDYYYQYLVSQYENIRELANSGGQQNLSAGIIKSIHVPIPPQLEQRKIAKILSTWDKAISTTERLIDNSTQQKKALMQQLLTGKKRLLDDSGKPFEGEWEEFHLVDIASIKKGKALSAKNVISGEYPVIAGGKTSPYSHNEYTHENIVTVSASGAYAGFVSHHECKIWASDCSVVTEKKGNCLLFIFQLLKLNQNKIYSMQSGGAQPHIYPKDLQVLKVKKPNLDEQQKIASVLTNADQEIELLEQQLADLKQEKKALMQQLLTGKRRVKVDDKEVA